MLLIFLFLFLLFQPTHRAQASTQNAAVLAVKSMSLNDRYPIHSVNEVFKENILLTLAYMREQRKPLLDDTSIDRPFHYELTLRPGQVFAFHDDVLSQYVGKVVATTNAHFNGKEGFKSDGYLFGDGVCHLASLIDYAAQGAGLEVVAPTRHDFAVIPEIPKAYGVSIYTTPNQPQMSARQNLYVTNTKPFAITMVFDYRDSVLTVSISKHL